MLLLTAMLGGGCVSRQDIGDDLNRGWYLDDNPWPRARAKPLLIGRQRLPTRWTFRREDSIVRSRASIARAADKLKAGADAIEMAISPAHADRVAKVLADGRAALEDLRRIADPDRPPSPEVWAAAVADALIHGEIVARSVAGDPGAPDTPTDPAGRPLGASAGPVLEMVIGYLNERAGGSLLAGMDARGAGRIRQIVTQVLLRLAFAVAGKQPPDSLHVEIGSQLFRARRPAELRPWLRRRLREELLCAAPGLSDEKLRSVLRTVLTVAPATLQMVESLIRQWSNICSLEMELRYLDGDPLMAITIEVVPRRTVRLARLHMIQPTILFRGRSRIIVIPEAPGTGEVALLFEPAPRGATEIRFDGLAYGAIRLMAMPLADGTLREIRMLHTDPCRGRRTLTVTMLMETPAGGDRRRMLVFHDVRDVHIVRDAFEVRTAESARDLTLNYLTPRHRYTFRRKSAR